LAEVVLSGLEKDPARRPPTAGTFAQRLRAVSEGESDLIRKSKDVFHSHVGSFLPVLAACLSMVVAVMIPVRLAAAWAAHARLAPEGALVVALSCCFTLLMVFAFQLFKAATTLMLLDASEKGRFQPAGGLALRKLGAGLGKLLGTQLLSMADLRPSSWWANVLWPVVWAAEGRSGKDAIARSRLLCGSLPAASRNLSVRQYGPPLIASLFFPCFMSIPDSTLHSYGKEVLAGSGIGSLALFEPIVFGMMFLGFGAAFSFLYWSALRCRNEGIEITLPTAAREDSRKSAARTVRPATLIWAGVPAVMLALVVWRVNGRADRQAMEDASNDGRRTALLKLIDGGLGVEQPLSGQETALFEAVRDGDETLVNELLKRGAKVNVGTRGSPLLLAAELGRIEMARVLLDRGAKVDASNRDGRTPLMQAAMRGNVALTKLLLERGANVTLVDNNGKTAAAYAAEEGYGELAGLLQKGK
jgi:hypothetical protein